LDIEQKFPLRKLTIHMGLKQGDFQLLQFVNTFIFLQRTSGDLGAAYKKYFGVDMPLLPSF
jgi:polar amino acid transport system substrate-binding protein